MPLAIVMSIVTALTLVLGVALAAGAEELVVGLLLGDGLKAADGGLLAGAGVHAKRLIQTPIAPQSMIDRIFDLDVATAPTLSALVLS